MRGSNPSSQHAKEKAPDQEEEVPGPATQPRDRLELVLPARPESARTARHELATFAERVGAPAAKVRIAVGEAVGNAVLHAFRDREPGSIGVTAELEDDSALRITVSDDGIGMRPNPHSQGLGFGLPLIGGVSDEFAVSSGSSGTDVEMRFPAGEVRR
jgi:anti-sigma regulatory factor (Ser/Thr protein kinase)